MDDTNQEDEKIKFYQWLSEGIPASRDTLEEGENVQTEKFSRRIQLSKELMSDCGELDDEGGIIAPRYIIDRVLRMLSGEPEPEPEPEQPETDDEPTAPAEGMKRYLVSFCQAEDYMDYQIYKYWLYPEQVETIKAALAILSKHSINLEIEEIA